MAPVDPRPAPPEPQTQDLVTRLQRELEIERLRLAACGGAALGYFTGYAPEYDSASLQDVLRQRDENTNLRASLLACTNALKAYTPGDYAPGQQIIRQAMQLLGEPHAGSIIG